MKSLQYIKISLILAVAILITGCQSTDAPPVSPEGMQLKHNTSSTIEYRKEGVNFADYSKVQFAPSTVAFKNNWQRDYNRNQTNMSSRLKDRDVVRIKESVKVLLEETFKAEFGKEVGYPIVEHATTGTLLLKPSIIDLDVNAPDIMSATRRKTYVNEAGRATLFLEIYDAVSGEILARITDTETVGDNHGFHRWANRVTNTADAKRVIKKWAKNLRKKFDQAHVK
ncbi:MAG: DUF3313 family protein [Colwellia sp.]|jgi:Protein of unknown function (DUF3313).